MRSDSQDRAEVERVFHKYLQSLEAADVALASQVWLQSPDVLVVTPIGRFQGWDGVKEIWARTQKEFSERKVQASNVSIVVPIVILKPLVRSAARIINPQSRTNTGAHVHTGSS